MTNLVRAKGLEPPHLAIPEPKSGASTSSATPASVSARSAASIAAIQRGSRGNRSQLVSLGSDKEKRHGYPAPATDASGQSAGAPARARSEERRVGKERVSTCRYRWSP